MQYVSNRTVFKLKNGVNYSIIYVGGKEDIFMKFDFKDYISNLVIDKYALDDECLKQPVLFDYYSNEWADASAKQDKAKQKLENYKAELEKKVRLKLAKEKDRVTEKAVENEVLTNTKYQKLCDRYILAKAKANKSRAVKDAFAQKKDMIKILTDLFISNYYGEVRTAQEKELTTEAIAKGIRKMMKAKAEGKKTKTKKKKKKKKRKV